MWRLTVSVRIKNHFRRTRVLLAFCFVSYFVAVQAVFWKYLQCFFPLLSRRHRGRSSAENIQRHGGEWTTPLKSDNRLVREHFPRLPENSIRRPSAWSQDSQVLLSSARTYWRAHWGGANQVVEENASSDPPPWPGGPLPRDGFNWAQLLTTQLKLLHFLFFRARNADF